MSFMIAIVSGIVTTLFLVNNSYRNEAELRVISMSELYAQVVSDSVVDIYDESESYAHISVPETLSTTTHLTLLDENCNLLYTNNISVSEEDIGNWSEVSNALNGVPEVAIRATGDNDSAMAYYAVLCKDASGNTVILSVGVAVTSSNQYMTTAVFVLVGVAIILFIATYILANNLSKSAVKPIEDISTQLSKLSKGELHKMQLSNFPEFDIAISSVDDIATTLESNIRQLNIEKHKISNVLDSIHSAIVTIDEQGEIVIMNSHTKKLFDITDNLVGKDSSYLTSNRDIQTHFYYGNDLQLTKINYKDRVYNMRIKTFIEQGFTILILSDITDEVKLNEVKSSFFLSAGHELKTPITAIKGFTEILDSTTTDPTSKKHLATITKNVDRLLAIISDMMEISRHENRTMSQERSDLSLASVCQEAIENCRSAAALKEISINLSGDTTVYFDQAHLYTMILNLIENAIAYNNTNGTVDIEITEKCLTIKDTGIGIPDKHLHRIFERFYRVEKARSRKGGGTGLGLSIVKHIALNNQVNIDVASIINKGTTFTLTFSK